jgi:putative FmdB family regulatory protein
MTHLVPTYVYKCDNDHTFEVIQSMSEDALDTCEICGAPARRQLFAPAVHFKGSGFYTTDYARKGAPKPAVNGSGGESSGGDSKSEKKADSSRSSDSSSSSKSESKTAGSKD